MPEQHQELPRRQCPECGRMSAMISKRDEPNKWICGKPPCTVGEFTENKVLSRNFEPESRISHRWGRRQSIGPGGEFWG
jgi:ribosomal protein S27AE